jgi:hypothetical protein
MVGEQFVNKLKSKHGNQIILGRVVGTGAMETRSMVEVELYDGRMTNAICWSQAEISVGDEVVLGQINGSDTAQLAVVSVNAPAQGLDPDSRDPTNVTMIYSGPTFRIRRVPKAGSFAVATQTQSIVKTTFKSLQTMHITLEFSIEPVLGMINGAYKYYLYAYDPSTANFAVAPDWKLEIGATWKQKGAVWQSEHDDRWRTTFDMDAPGYIGDYIETHDEIMFVLGLEVLSGAPYSNEIGRIRSLYLSFGADTEIGEIVMSSVSHMEMLLTPTDEGESLLEASGSLRLNKYFIEMDGTIDCEYSIAGAGNGLIF